MLTEWRLALFQISCMNARAFSKLCKAVASALPQRDDANFSPSGVPLLFPVSMAWKFVPEFRAQEKLMIRHRNHTSKGPTSTFTSMRLTFHWAVC